MNIVAALLVGGLVTFGMRLSFIYLLAHAEVSVRLRRALRFVPAAVLSAIILPALALPAGHLDLSVHNAHLIAGGLAGLVSWRTRNTLLTLLAGLVALLLLQSTL